MEKFYKVARIVAFVILAKIVLWDVIYGLLNIRWQYNFLTYTIITTFIFALLILTFSILIHNSERGSHVHKASILAIIGFGICIVGIICQYLSFHLSDEWFSFEYVSGHSIVPLSFIIGEILLCIAILSITRLFPKKSFVFISGIIYFVCLLVSILSDVYYHFWVICSNYYDFSSSEWHIYSTIVYICNWLEQISLLLFVFSLSKISKKKQ